MSKKRLNSEMVLSELSEQSVFFQKQAPNDLKSERSDERTNERSTVRSVQRTKVRHTFDIYADQIVSLHQHQLETIQNEGIKPHLGEMVQEALDDYLVKKGVGKSKETVRSNGATNDPSNDRI
jgi:uncharacterized membrane protein